MDRTGVFSANKTSASGALSESVKVFLDLAALDFDFTLSDEGLFFEISLKPNFSFSRENLPNLGQEEVHDVVEELRLRIEARFVQFSAQTSLLCLSLLAELFVDWVSLVGDSGHLNFDSLDFLKGPLFVVIDVHVLATCRGEHSCHLAFAVGTRAAAWLDRAAPLRTLTDAVRIW